MMFFPNDPEQQTTAAVVVRKESHVDTSIPPTQPTSTSSDNETGDTNDSIQAITSQPMEVINEPTIPSTIEAATVLTTIPATIVAAPTTENQSNPPPSSSSSASSSISDNNESLQFCQSTTLTAIDGNVHAIPHVCQGPLYQHSTQQINAFAIDQSYRRSVTQPMWGKRRSLPPSLHKILWYGNEQLLQVVQALVCQHQHNLQTLQIPPTPNNDDDHTLYRYTVSFDGTDATATKQQEIWAFINSMAPYSSDWLKLTEQQLEGQTLESFDAIVLGPFVTCAHDTIYCTEQSPSPVLTLSTLATHFSKPIIYITSWDNRNDISGFFDLQTVEKSQPQRKNVHFLPSRRYIEALNEGDCWSVSSDYLDASNTLVPDCHTNHGNFVCTGSQGSYADLVVWDVLELLNQYTYPSR
jgi:hypothetical protein